MTRRLGLVLIFVIILLAACNNSDDNGGGEPFVQPARPNILIENAGVTVGGQVTNICWPLGEGNVQCEPNFDTAPPADTLIVSREDTVAVALGDSIQPDELVVVSRDTNGDPLFSQTFRAGEAAQFPVASLQDGENLLEITAYYYDLAGSEAVVSSLFSVEVGTAVAVDSTPTEEPSSIPTETVDETPVVEESETPADETETPAVVASPEATEVSDETPVVEESETPTAETETPAVVASPDATEIIDQTPVVEESETPVTETETPAVVASPEATEVIDQTPVVEESETPVDETETPTTEGLSITPTALPSATPTLPPTTVVPSATPTVTPSLTFTPTPTVTPTETLLPSATPTEPQPTSEAEAFFGAVPPLQLVVTGREYLPIGYTYCEPNATNQVVCISQPTESTRRVRLFRQSGAMSIQIGSEERPETVEYRIVDATTLRPLARGERAGANVLLLSFTLAPGDYLLSVEVTWPASSGTYYFRLQVQG